MHIGKLPPAIPALQASLGVSLLEAGFLLSAAQLAGMLLGAPMGALADGVGLRRSLLAGLVLMAVASVAGMLATSATALLALRALEGLGVLWVALPVPSLLRRLVAPSLLARHLGWWGAYMPTGAALALLGGPLIIDSTGWQGLWATLSALSAAMALGVWRAVPVDPPRPRLPSAHRDAAVARTATGFLWRLRETLSRRGPWVVALAFAMYSSQWLAVVGFLPSVYAQAGVEVTTAGALTAWVCAVNILGNVGAGQLLHRGWSPQRLLVVGFVTMGACTWLAFHPLTVPWPSLRYLACAVFSAVGGLIPGTLFYLAVRVAPSEHTASTTVGWMQQCSSAGQFAGPPLVAWVAHGAGGWHWTWAITGLACALGLLLVRCLPRNRAIHRPPPA
jgi:MFS family permease